MLLLWWLLLCWAHKWGFPPIHASIKAEVEGNTVPFTETFVFFDTQFLFFSERVTWDEAAAICPSYKAQLAVVDVERKAEFVAETIADSNTPMEDIWIGGRKVNDMWVWTGSGTLIETKVNPDGFPPWVNAPNRQGRDCMAMDRRGHDAPLFVDLDCRQTRPFICEKSSELDSSVPKTSRRVHIGDSLYTLYHARSTWNDAVAFCRQSGKRLAIIPNIDVANIVAQSMTRSRPDFENAWIGARFQYGSWVWVPSGHTIHVKTDPYTGYPPWRLNKTYKHDGCLLLDRHLCDTPIFLEAKCQRTRDFICEEVVSHEDTSTPERHKYKMLTYELVPINKTWPDSVEACQERGGRLITLESREMLDFIMQVMAEYTKEITHVWVAGKLEGKTWIWHNSGDPIIFPAGPDDFPPWCDNDTRPDMGCLNLDRADHNKPMLYGLECNNTQPYICQVDCTDPQPVEFGEWNCTASLLPQDRLCNLTCLDGTILFGTEVASCSVSGWVGNRDLLLSNVPPVCTNVQNNSQILISKLYRTIKREEPSGFLFILDDSAYIKLDEFKSQLQLTSSLIQAFPLSSEFHSGVITFLEDDARVLLPYAQNDTCSMVEKLFTFADDRVNQYKNVDLPATSVLQNNRGHKSIVVLVTGGQIGLGKPSKILQDLHRADHIFFTVGIGSNISRSNLSATSSLGPDNHPNFFSYQNFNVSVDVSAYILDEFRSPQLTCNKAFMLERQELVNSQKLQTNTSSEMEATRVTRKNSTQGRT